MIDCNCNRECGALTAHASDTRTHLAHLMAYDFSVSGVELHKTFVLICTFDGVTVEGGLGTHTGLIGCDFEYTLASNIGSFATHTNDIIGYVIHTTIER